MIHNRTRLRNDGKTTNDNDKGILNNPNYAVGLYKWEIMSGFMWFQLDPNINST